MFYNNKLIDAVLETLKDEFDDNDDWISWWIYEKNFGTNDKINAHYKNKKEIKLNNSEDLYKFLIKNNKCRG